jgi:hypothetical protein
LQTQPLYVFSFPVPYPALVLSGRPSPGSWPLQFHSFQPNKICADISLIPSPKIKTLPGVFTVHYRIYRDPAHPLPTHLPTHCLTPFPPMTFKLSVHIAQIFCLIFPGFFTFRGQLT